MFHTISAKVMNLFRMYDLFPRDFEFVRVTAVPVIEAELSAFLSGMHGMDRHFTLSKFQHTMLTEFRQLQARRELHFVEDLRIELPSNGDPSQVKMVWSFRYGDPNNTHEMNIDHMLTQYERDRRLDIRYNAIRDQTELLKNYAKEVS